MSASVVLKGEHNLPLLSDISNRISGIGAAADTAVNVAEAGAKIMDIIRDENAKAVEAARQENNEFNACKSFLDNHLIAIKDATKNQFNVIIVTDQAQDVWWHDKPGVSDLFRTPKTTQSHRCWRFHRYSQTAWSKYPYLRWRLVLGKLIITKPCASTPDNISATENGKLTVGRFLETRSPTRKLSLVLGMPSSIRRNRSSRNSADRAG